MSVNFDCNVVVESNIDNAWRSAMWLCARNGHDYTIERGSFEGHIRRELEDITIVILSPWIRPLSPFMPENKGLPAPATEEYIEKYFMIYLMSDQKEENDYTYGNYILPQLSKTIDILNNSGGNTNHAIIAVEDTNSINLSCPPCLRLIQFKIVNKQLNMKLYFRSWDAYSGFPVNIGGLQLLKEYVLTFLDPSIHDGKITAYSPGFHLYDMHFDIVNQLCVDKIKEE